MDDLLNLKIQSKKLLVLSQLLNFKQKYVDNSIRYKEKSTNDAFYGGAFNISENVLSDIDIIISELETIFK